MSTRSLDLDLHLPADLPDLPPPWPSTDVAIDWWMSRTLVAANSATTEENLAAPYRLHYDEPFVLD